MFQKSLGYAIKKSKDSTEFQKKIVISMKIKIYKIWARRLFCQKLIDCTANTNYIFDTMTMCQSWLQLENNIQFGEFDSPTVFFHVPAVH